ncbi:MAG: hypothetical protein U0136_20295 [Bdellovibrionota bacterium]
MNCLSPQQIFTEVLLEKLTSPGVIRDALSEHPAESIFFAVAGVAFDRWIASNGLAEQDHSFEAFYHNLDTQRADALRLIRSQAAVSQEQAHPMMH